MEVKVSIFKIYMSLKSRIFRGGFKIKSKKNPPEGGLAKCTTNQVGIFTDLVSSIISSKDMNSGCLISNSP